MIKKTIGQLLFPLVSLEEEQEHLQRKELPKISTKKAPQGIKGINKELTNKGAIRMSNAKSTKNKTNQTICNHQHYQHYQHDQYHHHIN